MGFRSGTAAPRSALAALDHRPAGRFETEPAERAVLPSEADNPTPFSRLVCGCCFSPREACPLTTVGGLCGQFTIGDGGGDGSSGGGLHISSSLGFARLRAQV